MNFLFCFVLIKESGEEGATQGMRVQTSQVLIRNNGLCLQARSDLSVLEREAARMDAGSPRILLTRWFKQWKFNILVLDASIPRSGYWQGVAPSEGC